MQTAHQVAVNTLLRSAAVFAVACCYAMAAVHAAATLSEKG